MNRALTGIDAHRLAQAAEAWQGAPDTLTDGEYLSMVRDIHDEAAAVLGLLPADAEERIGRSSAAMQDHVGQLLRILGLGDHARPESPAAAMEHETLL